MITIDGASPLTSVNPVLSTVVGNEVRLYPRVQANEERTFAAGLQAFGNVCTIVSGVNGLTPTFRVDQSVGVEYYFPWQATEQGWFSYDNGLTWAKMGNAANFSGSFVTMSHNTPFTQDTVMVARNARVGTNRIAAWLADTSWQNDKLSNLVGGTNYIIGVIAAQIDELGRAIPAQPMYGFGIKSGAAGKPVIILTGGCHAAEDYAQECLMKGGEWLCSADVRATTLRQTFDFLVLPLMNPAGRMGGHYRGQFVYNGPSVPLGGFGNDLNRHFTDVPAPFDSVSIPRATMETETAGRTLSVLIDWHTGSGSPGPNEVMGAYTDQTLETTFISRLAANNSSGTCTNFGSPTPTGIHTYGQNKGAMLATVVEIAQASAVLVPSPAAQLEIGRAVLLSIYDLIPQLVPMTNEYDALIARMGQLKTELESL